MSERLRRFVREHRRWGVVALLFFIALINNLDRQTLSVLSPTLRETLGFGSIEYSYIVSSFLAAYTLGYAFCGPVLDRIGVKLGLALALGFWSLAGMAHAAAFGWISLAAFRFLLGLGESFNSPAGVKAIAEWVPKRERALSMAVFSNGNIWGAILAPPLVSFFTLHLGWRWAFIITGAAGFVLLWVWWRFFTTPAESPHLAPVERDYLEREGLLHPPRRPAPEGGTQAAPSMLAMLRHPLCVGFFVVRFLTDSTSYFFSFWLPDYLAHGRGFSLAMIGMVGWLPFLASDVGGPGGGALSDWLVRRGWSSARARKTVMAMAACAMPFAFLAVRVDSAWIAIALIALVLSAQSAWMTNQLTLISECVPRSSVATLLAFSALGGSLGGIVSNLLTGRAVAGYGYLPVFSVVGFLHLAAFAVLLVSERLAARGAGVRGQEAVR